MTTLIIEPKKEPQDVPGVVIPPLGVSEPVIKNTPFFPDVDPKRVREEMRLEQTVSPVRLRRAIKTAIAETNAELSDWRESQLDAGYATLADVPTDELDGESVRVFHYFNAVCSMTTATLYERFRGVDATGNRSGLPVDAGLVYQTPAMAAGVRSAHPLGLREWRS
ncbi:head completion/stabilization protein [Enterobacter asburiae]|uniref:head completion/stabilization protein n=1 Tax=Enterobacter asburiae TaxID=61645 RepID=UPI00380AD812